MKMTRLTLATAALLALTAPTYAGGYIPLGPKIYTPQPDIITPQPDLVTPQPDLITPQPDLVTPQPDLAVPQPPSIVTESRTPSYDDSGMTQTCFTASIFGGPYKNGPQCFVARTLNPGSSGHYVPQPDLIVPQPDLVTPQPDIVTPQPDLVTPQPPIVTPQPDSCSQLGFGSHGIDYYDC